MDRRSDADNFVAIVLAAGRGKRMGGVRPKVLQPVCGKPVIDHVLDTLSGIPSLERAVVVCGHGSESLRFHLRDRVGVTFAEQAVLDGSGGALAVCEPSLRELGMPTYVLVVCGDAPLQRAPTLSELVRVGTESGVEAAVLVAEPEDASGYGRVVLDANGGVRAIVEHADASDEQRRIKTINAGSYLFQTRALWRALSALSTDNAQAERYLPDVINAWVEQGRDVRAVAAGDAREALGINTPKQLGQAARVLGARYIDELLGRGVEIPSPEHVVIEADVAVGAGSRIEPFTILRRGVRIGDNCVVGPFAHISSSTVLDDSVQIGNFVEVKRSRIGPGTKAKHLAYIGDGDIGARTNIGAGTVFCNYDGKNKHRCVVGDGVSLGSGTLLVAPVEAESGSRTGAGAVVTSGERLRRGETWAGVPARPISVTRRGAQAC